MGRRLLDLVAKPVKMPEGRRFLLGGKGDFETDFPPGVAILNAAVEFSCERAIRANRASRRGS
jgi:hypothetical protein